MADRIYTSQKSEEILENLRFVTKLEINTLARIAFCLSLKKTGTTVQRSEDTSGNRFTVGVFLEMMNYSSKLSSSQFMIEGLRMRISHILGYS